MNLQGKTVVVTGATGGIGSEIVKKLDFEGANLILVSESSEKFFELSKKLKNKNCEYFSTDFADNKRTENVISQIVETQNKIDILINCAGIGVYKPIEDITLENWNDSMSINVTSVFLFTQKLLPLLSKQSDSLVLNIGSGAGVIPMAGRSVYCATKFALRGFTLSLAEEFKRVGNPKFCLISLGSTLTSFGPLSLETKKEESLKGKAYFEPKWVADKLIEIIKDDSREVEYTLYPGDYGFGTWSPPQAK